MGKRTALEDKEDMGMTADERLRVELGYHEKHDLPSRYWEPQPDEEDLARTEQEHEGAWMDDEPIPFE